MEQHKQESANLISLIIKVGVGVITGLMAKYSYELTRGRKLSILAWLGITGLSIFSGYLTALICQYYHYDEASKILVPLGTLFGEKIFEFFFIRFGVIFSRWALDNIDFWRDLLKGKKE